MPDGSIQSAVSSAEEIEGFLRSLFGDAAPGYVTIWTLPDRKTAWFPARDLAAAGQYAATRSITHDCYFGLGLQEKDLGPNSRGGSDTVIGIGGIWLDVDIKGPAHSQDRLLATVEEAISWLEE